MSAGLSWASPPAGRDAACLVDCPVKNRQQDFWRRHTFEFAKECIMALGSVWKWSLAVGLATAPGFAVAQGYNPYRSGSTGGYNTTAEDDQALASDSTEPAELDTENTDDEATEKQPTVARDASDDA